MFRKISVKSKKNEIIYFMIFSAGIILAVVALFLPWETVLIDENGFYQYLPFSGWVVHSFNVYDDMPAQLDYLMPFFIAIIVYCGVVIPLLLSCGSKTIAIKGNYHQIKDILVYIGPILMGGVLLIGSLGFILNSYYLPFVTIYIQYDEIERFFSYSMGEGMMGGLISVIFMSFGASMLQSQIEGLPPKQIKGLSGQLTEDSSAITQSQREIEEEYQRVEDQFAQAIYSKILTKLQVQKTAQQSVNTKSNISANTNSKKTAGPNTQTKTAHSEEPIPGDDMHELEH